MRQQLAKKAIRTTRARVAKPAAQQLHERRPSKGRHWVMLGEGIIDGSPRSDWQRSRVRVISSLDHAQLPGRLDGTTGLQWHVSISRSPDRAKPTEVALALRDFGMVGAEEDNHEPGIARHFWLCVDPADRVACDCKETEVTIVEPDGHTWTNPRDGECRGCHLQALTGRGCPLHS